jgi:hypothetical protein
MGFMGKGFLVLGVLVLVVQVGAPGAGFFGLLFETPLGDGGVVAGEEDFGNPPATELNRPGVLRETE